MTPFNDVNLAGDYTLSYHAEDVLGAVYSAWSFTLRIINPCSGITLRIDPAILSSKLIEYTVSSGPMTESIDETKIEPNETQYNYLFQ